MLEYALLVADDIDADEVRYGQLITLAIGLSSLVVARSVWLLAEFLSGITGVT